MRFIFIVMVFMLLCFDAYASLLEERNSQTVNFTMRPLINSNGEIFFLVSENLGYLEEEIRAARPTPAPCAQLQITPYDVKAVTAHSGGSIEEGHKEILKPPSLKSKDQAKEDGRGNKRKDNASPPAMIKYTKEELGDIIKKYGEKQQLTFIMRIRLDVLAGLFLQRHDKTPKGLAIDFLNQFRQSSAVKNQTVIDFLNEHSRLMQEVFKNTPHRRDESLGLAFSEFLKCLREEIPSDEKQRRQQQRTQKNEENIYVFSKQNYNEEEVKQVISAYVDEMEITILIKERLIFLTKFFLQRTHKPGEEIKKEIVSQWTHSSIEILKRMLSYHAKQMSEFFNNRKNEQEKTCGLEFSKFCQMIKEKIYIRGSSAQEKTKNAREGTDQQENKDPIIDLTEDKIF